MKSKKYVLTLGSATVDPAEAAQKIKDAGTMMVTTIAGLSDILEDPLKSKFIEVKNQINTMLKGMAPSDQAPAALGANDVLQCLLGVLASAQTMITSLAETAKSSAENMTATRASMTEEVTKAVDLKITSGELVKKEDVEKKISDATAAATTATREAVLTERKALDARRSVLTTAGLPIPADDALAGNDDEFTAKQASVKTRVDELKPFGLSAERVLTLAWNPDQKGYDETINLLKETFAKASKGSGANPFLKREAGNDDKKPILGVC